MHILRKLGLWLTGGFLRFLLLAAAIVGTVVMVFGTSTHIKQVLKDSNVYGTFVDGVIQEIRKNPETKTDASLPINDPIFQQSIKNSFTPEFLQATTENVVDGTYNWLTGKVKQPDFRIDITTQKQQFASSIGDYAVVKLNALPVCTRTQLLQMIGDIDPFNAVCRPANLDVAAQKQKIINDLMTNKDFLNNTAITTDSLQKDSDGKTFFQQQTIVPELYGWMSLSPYLLIGISILSAGAIVFLHRTKRKGFRTVGFILAETGAFLTIISFLSMWFYQNASQPGGAIDKSLASSSFRPTISKVLESITNLVNSRLMLFGVVYACIGLIIFAVLFFTRPKTKPNDNQKNEKDPEVKSSESPDNTTTPTKESDKSPRDSSPKT